MEILERANNIKETLDREKIVKRISDIEVLMTKPGFWDDREVATKLSQELSDLNSELENIELLDLLIEDGDEEELLKVIKELEVVMYMTGKHDKGGAFLSIHSGAGGTEAMDWTEMLYRMYVRYFEKKKWKYSLTNKIIGDEAGFKTVTLQVDGLYAYGLLKYEIGTHRLVRLSPFNAQNLRQTSFAGVEVLPVLEKNDDFKLNDEDLEFSTMRSSGAGGQNVNKLETAVRVKHLPSGVVVTCQQERGQLKNKEIALQILKAKLLKIELEKAKAEELKLKGEYKEAGWGNQIRSYVLHPYKLVKDHRSGYEVTNPDKVLDGDIDGFIQSNLKV